VIRLSEQTWQRVNVFFSLSYNLPRVASSMRSNDLFDRAKNSNSYFRGGRSSSDQRKGNALWTLAYDYPCKIELILPKKIYSWQNLNSLLVWKTHHNISHIIRRFQTCGPMFVANCPAANTMHRHHCTSCQNICVRVSLSIEQSVDRYVGLSEIAYASQQSVSVDSTIHPRHS